MSKHLCTALCCALLLSGGKAYSTETSLLDRLADDAIIGSGSPVPTVRPVAPPTSLQRPDARIDELTLQLNDALAQNHALEGELAMLKAGASAQPDGLAPGEGTDADIAGLHRRIDELQAQNRILAQQRDGQATDGAPSAARRVTVDAQASKDVRISYALGAWYGDSAPQETQKLRSIGRTLDLPAFAQGFDDSVRNRPQLSKSQMSAELAGVNRQLDAAMLSKNEKISNVLLAEAAKEKGAVKMPDGSVYRILKKGKPPLATAHSEILFELEEKLGTGEVLSPGEQASSKVADLPPAFQAAVTQLGLGGSAKFHLPAKLIYGESGGAGDVPPGAISIMTLKIVGIK